MRSDRALLMVTVAVWTLTSAWMLVAVLGSLGDCGQRAFLSMAQRTIEPVAWLVVLGVGAAVVAGTMSCFAWRLTASLRGLRWCLPIAVSSLFAGGWILPVLLLIEQTRNQELPGCVPAVSELLGASFFGAWSLAAVMLTVLFGVVAWRIWTRSILSSSRPRG